jgi:hypothetical protein
VSFFRAQFLWRQTSFLAARLTAEHAERSFGVNPCAKGFFQLSSIERGTMLCGDVVFHAELYGNPDGEVSKIFTALDAVQSVLRELRAQ